ncbi:MAG: alkylation response protein AidB-like acyl-CoA dehydrogenase [Gammaproteobacteria bacterium]|jgi:alkylation response protein AidB-like acyl-CoA dehydrogenase
MMTPRKDGLVNDELSASHGKGVEECVERAARLGELIAAQGDAIEKERHLPEVVVSALHDEQLMRMLAPRSVAGLEVTPSHYLETIRTLAHFDGSVAWNAFVANSSALIAAHLPLDVAREIYADPRALIAWGPPNQYQATAVEGGYQVAGIWPFASGCRHATWMGAHCQVVEADGALRLHANGHPGIRTLLFPANEAKLLGDWNPIGLRGTGSESYEVSGVFVPEHHSSTREEPDARRERGPLYAFTQQGLYAVGVAGVALGIAGGMLDAFIELSLSKTPRGLARNADRPGIQAEVARATAALGSARAWLLEILDTIYQRSATVSSIDTADRAQVRLACSDAIQKSIEVATTTYRLAGVDAIFPGSHFERRFRDINTLSQQIQSRPAHFEAVGAILLGATPITFY